MSSILGSFIAGQQAGQQQHKYRQEQSKLAQLRELAPQVLAGNPEAYGQSMALDSAHTGRLQDGRMKQLSQLEGVVKLVDEARASGDPRRLSGAMHTIAPFMNTFAGVKFDPKVPWTPDFDAGWDSFKAMVTGARAGGTGDTLQSQKVGEDGFIYNTFRDGRMVNTGVRADRQMWFRDHPGMDPQLVGKDGSVQTVGQPLQVGAQQSATATYVPAEGGGQMLMRTVIGADGRPYRVEVGNDESAQVGAADMGAGEQVARVELPAQGAGAYRPAGGSLARPSPAQEAAATEAARQQVQLQYLPQELAMRGQAAVEQAVGIERGKNEAERDAQAPKRIQSYQQALAASQNVATSIDKALGMIGPMSTGFLGARSRGIEGSPAYNLAAEIETVKANLGFDRLQQMRDNSPTGGALGAIAVQELVALQSTIANLDPNQSDDQLRANLGRVKEHYDRWKATVQQAMAEEQSKQRQGGQPPAAQAGQQPAAAPVQRARNPQTGQVVEFRNGQWVPVQ